MEILNLYQNLFKNSTFFNLKLNGQKLGFQGQVHCFSMQIVPLINKCFILNHKKNDANMSGR